MGNILFKAIAGMVAGIVAWVIVEPFKPSNLYSQSYEGWEKWLIVAWALALGATIGFMSGYQRGSRTHAWQECGISTAFAVAGILMAMPLAAPFARFINPEGSILANIIPRTITIAIMGGGLGFGIGMGTFVLRRGIQGLVGGVLGGAIAGALFDTVATATGGLMLTANSVNHGEIGAVARALTAIIMCGAIALMIGIIEALSRSAWLRLELGRNEGKEWVLDKGTMLLGRFERADIPLFGDQNVVPQHAVIQKQGNQYVVVDQGSPIGIAINGNRVQQAVLNAGDVLQIGSFNLRFLMRNVKAPNRGPEPNRNNSYAMGSVPNQYPQQPAAAVGGGSQLNTPSQMAMQQQPMGQPQMQPTMMNPAMQPTMMNPAMQQTVMNPTMMQQPYQSMDPTVAVPAQGGYQPQSGGMPTLVATDGPLTGQRFPLNMPIDLGRECQQVPMSFDTSASRKHARIEPSGMFVNVTDLGSTNGTFVNGQRVTNATAKNGDIVKVGATNFRIES